MVITNKADIVASLQTDILRMQGFKPATSSPLDLGLGPIADCFPNRAFPTGAIHELITDTVEDLSAAAAFTTGLLGSLTAEKGICLWISSGRRIFPPALYQFGLKPDHVVFVDLKKEKDVLWTMDEALKCSVITSVVAELKDISFNESRKLQLAVEQSKATGFLLRNNVKKLSTTTCVTRWKITSTPSEPIGNLPGIGYPKWKIELLRMRNGKTGSWYAEWRNGSFFNIQKLGTSFETKESFDSKKLKVG